MKCTIKTCALIGGLMITNAAWSCSRPDAPVVPDAAQAVTPQMVKAKNDVQAYMKAANDYLGCIRNDRKHNAMVSEMESIAGKFNNAVRDFKQRMASK
ncbi:hypothetical protein [Halioxenophilus aromaticivorans]|uniref:Uncharacterized protein n=1 Tax=Halioxenophilus aromaticivorans TaxID=1306992 RepID=A0AAV3U9T8_9ALTE